MSFTHQLVASMIAIILASVAHGAITESDVERHIDLLAETSHVGIGYSVQTSGQQFLPYPDSAQQLTGILGAARPTNSQPLEELVKMGARAVPPLLKHLDDDRITPIPTAHAMWMTTSNNYDVNVRIQAIPDAKGVNGGSDESTSHTITIGDLCYVALGQIVNRNFSATKYVPSGGLGVNSPTSSKILCESIRNEYQNFTAETHHRILTQDLDFPDTENRRNGAMMRLSYYFPAEAESVALKMLAVPTYNIRTIEPFVVNELYPESSAEIRKQKWEAFVHSNGPSAVGGIRYALFYDLDRQEADENYALHPPRSPKYDARRILIDIYGYGSDVKSQDKPYETTWDSSSQGRFIDALSHLNSEKIDAEVHQLLRSAGDQDYLAFDCIRRLVGKGFDQELLAECEKRMGRDGYLANYFPKVIATLRDNLRTSAAKQN